MTPKERSDAIVAHFQRLHKLPVEVLYTIRRLPTHVAFRKDVYTALCEDGMTCGAIARRFGQKTGSVRACINPAYVKVKK